MIVQLDDELLLLSVMCQLEYVELLLMLFYMSAATKRCLRKVEDISEADGEETKSV
mgnify:CR=1 FL=1